MGDNIKKAPYKSGMYIGESIDHKGDKTLIKVQAVLKHPNQGDLHHPKQADVPLFHERKALAFNEKVWVPTKVLHTYEGEIPEYNQSLADAVHKLEEDLKQREDTYGNKALETLKRVKGDYYDL